MSVAARARGVGDCMSSPIASFKRRERLHVQAYGYTLLNMYHGGRFRLSQLVSLEFQMHDKRVCINLITCVVSAEQRCSKVERLSSAPLHAGVLSFNFSALS